MARDYNRKSSENDDRMVRQLAGDNVKTMQNMYRKSYQNTWSPMTSLLPDIDPIGIHTNLRTPSVFDEPSHTMNNNYTHSKRRNTLPYLPQRSSHISNLKVLNRFQLAKIPEIVISSSSSLNIDQNTNNENEPGPSNSTKRSHKFTVTPTDVNELDK